MLQTHVRRTAARSAAALLACTACHHDTLLLLDADASAPASLGFGEVLVGDQKALTLVVVNKALVPLDLTGAQAAPPYFVTLVPGSIPAGATGTLQITFKPRAAQEFDAALTLSLSSTRTPSLTVKLTGAGTAVAPADGCGCASGSTCCTGACVDTQTDNNHCGGCAACASGASCVNGHCEVFVGTCDDATAPCQSPQKCCDHQCVDTGPSGLCACAVTGGGTTFAAGTLIIPMDACWQLGKDVTTPSYCTHNAKPVADDSPLKAYGLVYFLLRHQVTVYMAIDPAKASVDAVDMRLDSGTSSAPVLRYDWASSKAIAVADDTQSKVEYRGAPFLIDASQHDRVLDLLAKDPDFEQFRTAGNITLHVAKAPFQSAIAKSITVVPSKVALLVPTGDNNANVNILISYLTSAGLNFPGAGPSGSTPGQIYDVLQQADFLPNYNASKLKAGGYKLLWAPHWEGDPFDGNLPRQLATIGAYVAAGGDLFAECAAIGTLEGVPNAGAIFPPAGSPSTRFMTSRGVATNLNGHDGSGGPFTFGGLASPLAQRGDFPFAGFIGLIADFIPDSHAPSSYNAGVVRYITGGSTDYFTSIDGHASHKGTVVYLAGHDYSYTLAGHGGGGPKPGMTAGSRLVLNTLFTLGTNNVCAP